MIQELFAWLLCLDTPMRFIELLTDLGDALAQAETALKTQGDEESFRWAEKSAAQQERDGFYYLGYCYRYGVGCEKDWERAKENFLVAAELGNVRPMVHLGELLDRRSTTICLVWKSCRKWSVFLLFLLRNVGAG
jgi:TPR repeat protein